MLKNKILIAEFITPSEAIDLRSRILRPGQPIENCIYDGDNLNSSFHLGVRLNENQIICNGTFIQQPHKFFKSSVIPYRLRGMATDSQFQKQGLGSLIINTALKIIKDKQGDLLWFNARTSAEIFYSKLGFCSTEEIFDIPLAGPHKVMYKWL
ncbi:MAG: GNAT family N-acetyltransferase [Pseudobdellovibrio sp.]